MYALLGISKGNFERIAAFAEPKALLMIEIEFAENAIGHRAGGHDHVGGVGVELGVDAAGIDLVGPLADVDYQLIDVSVGDKHGAFGFHLELELWYFQRDRLGRSVRCVARSQNDTSGAGDDRAGQDDEEAHRFTDLTDV